MSKIAALLYCEVLQCTYIPQDIFESQAEVLH